MERKSQYLVLDLYSPYTEVLVDIYRLSNNAMPFRISLTLARLQKDCNNEEGVGKSAG